MPGSFVFRLADPDKFQKGPYLQAIKDSKKIKPPPEIYASYGPEEMGVGAGRGGTGGGGTSLAGKHAR